MRLPGVDVFQQVVARHMLDGVDAQRVHPHVEIAVDGTDQIILTFWRSVARLMQSPAICFNCTAALSQSPPQMKPCCMYHSGSSVWASMPKKRPDCSRTWARSRRSWDRPAESCLRVHGVPLPIPLGRDRIIDVVAVRPGVVAEIALIRSMVDAALLGALWDIVFDRQMIDVNLAADAILTGMVDHHVLNDLDAALVRLVDQILIGRVRRFQPGIDPSPIVGVVAVIIEAAAVLDRWRDPDGGETQITDVVQALDQPLEITAPMRVFGLTGLAVELDAVAAEKLLLGSPS